MQCTDLGVIAVSFLKFVSLQVIMSPAFIVHDPSVVVMYTNSALLSFKSMQLLLVSD